MMALGKSGIEVLPLIRRERRGLPCILYSGNLTDEREQIEARFRQALDCDVVVSTGGVSVGDRDWVVAVGAVNRVGA